MPFLESLTKVQGAYQLDVYGDGNDFKKAKKYTRSHHLKVNFHGPTPFTKIYPEIIKSHLDVLNSYNFDTFGMTLVEAESAGTPALFVDPDLKEIIPVSGDYWSKTTHGMVSDGMTVRRSSAGTTSDSNSSSYYTLCYK